MGQYDKILKLEQKVYGRLKLIPQIVGDGRICSRLEIRLNLTRRGLYDARLPDYARVADMIRNDQWIWPRDWYHKFP